MNDTPSLIWLSKSLSKLGISSTTSGSGKVLQAVSFLTAVQSSQSITPTDTVVNGIFKSITPLGANSKFLVTVRWFGEITNPENLTFNIQMDGTRVNIDNQGRGYALSMATHTYSGGQDNASTPEMMHLTTLVETSSVAGTAIVFQLVADRPEATEILWNNRCFQASNTGQERGTSEIIISEIGA